MRLAMAGFVKIYANQYVLDEAERNILLKYPEHIGDYYDLLAQVKPIMTSGKTFEKLSSLLKKIIPANDIPVFIGAVDGKVKFLVSLDRRHVISKKIRDLQWPFEIVLPGEFLRELKGRSAEA